MLQSPFKNLSSNQEIKLTFLLISTTLALIICMFYLDSYLKNEICTNGILSFELAKELNIAKSYINSWNETSRIVCGISLGLDYLFLLSYASLIAILIHKLNEKLWAGSNFYKLGIILINLLFVAAFFDAIENFGLIQLLLGNLEQKWVSLSYYFAIPKFIIIIIGIIYILFNFVYRLIKK